jgi:hypothetical protein
MNDGFWGKMPRLIDWNQIRELAFRRVAGWWPRCFLALSALYEYRTLSASAAELRVWARRKEISYKTIQRGLAKLKEEGLVEERGLYMLTPKGFRVAELTRYAMSSIQKCIEGVVETHSIDALNKCEAELRTKINSTILPQLTAIETETAKEAAKFIVIYLEESIAMAKRSLEIEMEKLQLQKAVKGS